MTKGKRATRPTTPEAQPTGDEGDPAVGSLHATPADPGEGEEEQPFLGNISATLTPDLEVVIESVKQLQYEGHLGDQLVEAIASDIPHTQLFGPQVAIMNQIYRHLLQFLDSHGVPIPRTRSSQRSNLLGSCTRRALKSSLT